MILLTGGCLLQEGVCSQGGCLVPGGGGLSGPRGCLLPGRGCLLPEGLVWSGRGVPGGDPLGTATAAGSTHPTGMHSCLSE